MSGIFDALRFALTRPDVDQVDREERDIHSDGEVNQASDIGHVSHHRQTITAPSTPAKAQALIDHRAMNTPPGVVVSAPEPDSPANTADADTSYSTAADISGSTMSTQAEIHLCPQPTPFVYRRRALTDGHEDPLPKAVHFNPHFRQKSSPANVHIRPEILELVQPPSEASIEKPTEGLTKWRQEQLANMKPGKLTGNGGTKVLSSLHGPLSLPYARNPSGVDATVPDTSAHYSNTFGLRAVPRHSDNRVVSGSTDATQSSTGSSLYLGNRQKHFSDSEKGHSSNMLIRDPVQGNASVKGFDGRRLPVLSHPAHFDAIKEEHVKKSLNAASAPFDTRLMAHRALGVHHPSALADPFKPLVDSALARAVGDDVQHLSRYDDATIARLMSTARYYGLELRKASDSSTGSRIPSNESSKVLLTPGQVSASHSSKADVSANWRAKGKYHDPSGHIEVHSPSKHFAVAAESPPPGPIMTIDELMEKFSGPSGSDKEKVITVKAPPAAEKPVEAPVKPVKPVNKVKAKVVAAAAADKSKSPLGERSTNMSPPPVPTAKAVEAKKAVPKGTPNAGKLLKKSHVSQVKSTSSKSASKLGAISEQADKTAA